MPSFEDDPDDPREATRQVPVTTATFKKGEVLAGKYRIEKVLGRGGMGHVFAAMHLDLDQLVAIKVMHKEMLGDADSVMRFGREAKAAAAMRGLHTARIFDVGKLEASAARSRPSRYSITMYGCALASSLPTSKMRAV